MGILCLLPLVACEQADGPVDPVWGKQPCAHCAMLVSEPHHAAQAITADGARHYFDDLGCMALHAEEKPLKKAWAREGASGGWLDVEAASFRSGAKTPMDFGFEIVAGGGTHDWTEVRAAVRERMQKR
jgi:hypothetical protein